MVLKGGKEATAGRLLIVPGTVHERLANNVPPLRQRPARGVRVVARGGTWWRGSVVLRTNDGIFKQE